MLSRVACLTGEVYHETSDSPWERGRGVPLAGHLGMKSSGEGVSRPGIPTSFLKDFLWKLGPPGQTLGFGVVIDLLSGAAGVRGVVRWGHEYLGIQVTISRH